VRLRLRLWLIYCVGVVKEAMNDDADEDDDHDDGSTEAGSPARRGIDFDGWEW
jgi:hypothetical protein